MINTLLNMILMQGYGVYIWGSVFLTVSILVGNFWYARYEYRNMQEKVRDEKL